MVLKVAAVALAASVAVQASPVPMQTPSLNTSEAIAVEMCVAQQQSENNPNLKVGIAFRDLRDLAATHVAFDIVNVAPDGAPVALHHVSIDGSFAPQQLIEPRRAAFSDGLLTQPEYSDSPAWNVPNHFGSGATQVRCVVSSATFRDGSVWNRPSLDQ